MPDTNCQIGPLDGVRVLEIATIGAAPFATRLLQDFGATVVKVEDPTKGDPGRQITPLVNGVSLMFARVNANKQSIAVNLRSEEGQQVIKKLLPHFDVVTENFRPGRIARWGLDYDTLRAVNPRIIMLHMSGFGQVGPRSPEPGFGGVAEAISGYTYVSRWPEDRPHASPFMLGDSTAAFGAAIAVSQALFRRERTGEGAELDCTLYEPLMKMMGDVIARFSATGKVPQPTGSRSFGGSPRGTFEASDGGWITVSAVQQNIAERLFNLMGQPELIEDPRFATNADRVQHDREISEIVEQWIAKYPRDEVVQMLNEAEVPVGKLYTGEDIAHDEHFLARGSIRTMDHPDIPGLMVPGPAYRLAGYEPSAYQASPTLGEHTQEILQEIGGFSDAELVALRDKGAINF
ncbi:CaiB/BaiF CoA transferase family protein [Rhodococcus sp. WAY2]|uniref:CaiB/BaiF CoA transferase family protein n=1 Tax=Rhodococcus sp. WAY2 TaxID=2663121 RepID=UPI00131F7757|nr:CoA transferase [Rhodococcus sp. WAY2]QHE73269.1 CAIB/BAIF family protein [Rhodococcus sp. WAY2]